MRPIFAIVLLFTLFAFGKKKQYTIFSKQKEYHYDALFFKADGDTLTRETIILKPKGRGWIFQRSQTAYKVIYHPDTVNLTGFVNPVNKRRLMDERVKAERAAEGKPFYGIWRAKTTSGAVEDEKEVWTHPFRSNQYIYTEVAPFPEVYRDSLIVGRAWSSRLSILSGWDNFIGEVKSVYTVKERVNYKHKHVMLNDCWLIHAVASHSALGKSTNNFIFHPENGFVRLDYTFYDGVRILFKMKSIITEK